PILLEHILSCDELPPRFPLDQAKAKELARTYFPNAVPLLWQMALREFKSQRYKECAGLQENILQLGQTDTYNMLVSFRPSILFGDAQLNLGVCYARLGRLSAAKKCFTALQGKPQYEQRARTNLDQIATLLDSSL